MTTIFNKNLQPGTTTTAITGSSLASEYLDNITPGVATGLQALVFDNAKNVTGINSIGTSNVILNGSSNSIDFQYDNGTNEVLLNQALGEINFYGKDQSLRLGSKIKSRCYTSWSNTTPVENRASTAIDFFCQDSAEVTNMNTPVASVVPTGLETRQFSLTPNGYPDLNIALNNSLINYDSLQYPHTFIVNSFEKLRVNDSGVNLTGDLNLTGATSLVKKNGVERIGITDTDVNLRGTRVNVINPTTSNRLIEFGTDATDTVYIDFHSKDSINNDHHSRIIAYGGATAANTGTLKVTSTSLQLDGLSDVAVQKNGVTRLNLSTTGVNVTGDLAVSGTISGTLGATTMTELTVNELNVSNNEITIAPYGGHTQLQLNFNKNLTIVGSLGELIQTINKTNVTYSRPLVGTDLSLSGLFQKAPPITITASSYTVSQTIDYTFIILDTTTNAITLNLGDPAATTALRNREIHIKILGPNNITFNPTSPAKIDTVASITSSGAKTAYTIASNDSNWYIISRYGGTL